LVVQKKPLLVDIDLEVPPRHDGSRTLAMRKSDGQITQNAYSLSEPRVGISSACR
jgi:hypothetical protein